MRQPPFVSSLQSSATMSNRPTRACKNWDAGVLTDVQESDLCTLKTFIADDFTAKKYFYENGRDLHRAQEAYLLAHDSDDEDDDEDDEEIQLLAESIEPPPPGEEPTSRQQGNESTSPRSDSVASDDNDNSSIQKRGKRANTLVSQGNQLASFWF